MSAIILLLIVSISVASLFLLAFIWSVKNGQYDDEVSPPMRMLFDNKDAITHITGQPHIKPKS
ncbi:MAG: cbb3-type cytochrome oxidase assembly protein CcoS [Bacteroidota bacterium]